MRENDYFSIKHPYSEWSKKFLMVTYFSLSNDSRKDVEQFPVLSRTTFGGKENLKLRVSKSSSLVII